MTDPDIVTRLREADGGYFMRSMFTEAANEIERLREELVSITSKLTAERDHARRGLCYEVAAWVADFKHSTHQAESRAEAERRGWDCFKEET